MPRKTVKTMDNIEWMSHIATFSDHGALMQMFMLDALYKYATKVASMDPKDVAQAMRGSAVNAEAWHGTAKELVRRFEERA